MSKNERDHSDDDSSVSNSEPDGETLGSDDSDEEEEPSSNGGSAKRARVVSDSDDSDSESPPEQSSSSSGRHRSFCFTINNYSPTDLRRMRRRGGLSTMKCMVIGKEGKGEGKTPHLQCFMSFKTPKTFSACLKWFQDEGMGRVRKPHLEIAKDNHAAWEYCKKEGDFEEFGVPPVPPKEAAAHRAKGGGDASRALFAEFINYAERGELDKIKESKPKMYVSHYNTWRKIAGDANMSRHMGASDAPVEWFFGGTGTGKSFHARRLVMKWMVEKHDVPAADCERRIGEFLYVKSLNKWWCGYTYQPYVLIEEMNPVFGEMIANHLKCWTDRVSFHVEAKGATMQIRPDKFIITSNWELVDCFAKPEDREPMLRRCNVWEFTDMNSYPICKHRRPPVVMPEGEWDLEDEQMFPTQPIE